MATVLLGLAGGLIAGPVGSTAFLIGQAIGGIVGSFADQAIISALTPPMRREGPRSRLRPRDRRSTVSTAAPARPVR